MLRLDSVQLDEQLTFEEDPVLILASDVRQLCTTEIHIVKVQWKHRPVEEATGRLRARCGPSILTCLRL